MEIQKVMDRAKVANSIHEILDTGVELLKKEKLTQDDHAKIKVIRTMGTHVNAAISMIQQETAQLRAAIVVERMKQLGYGIAKQLE
jgi:hypothetical protein